MKHGCGAVNIHIESQTIKTQSIHLLYHFKQSNKKGNNNFKKMLWPLPRVKRGSEGLVVKISLLSDCAMSTSDGGMGRKKGI